MDARELRRALRRKLGAEESREQHHVYYYKDFGGGQRRVGKLSHSASGQLDDYITGDNAKRLRVTVRELSDFVDCALTKEDHKVLWHDRPNWPFGRI